LSNTYPVLQTQTLFTEIKFRVELQVKQ